MPRLHHALDDVQIRHWIAKGEPVAKADGDGLTFTLSGSGTATWVLRYSRGNRRRELTIGNYPDMSLAAARKAARAFRVEIDKGEDPAADKKTEKARTASALTVRQLCDDYKEKAMVSLAEGSVYNRNWDIENMVKPNLGSLEARKVTSADIIYMLETSGKSWNVCNRVLGTVTVLFDHAIGKRIVQTNPTAGIKLRALLGEPPPVRQRLMLTEDELRILLPDIDDKIGSDNGLMFRVLLATCVRTSELVKARKEHFDLKRGTWWIPPQNLKAGFGALVPLVPTVVNWIEDLMALSGESEWLLPARAGKRRKLGDTHMGVKTLWASISRAFESSKLEMRYFTPHDTRSTAKGHMRNMGVSREISEIALNHKVKGVEGIYDVREEIPERRAAMALWAVFVSDCCEGNNPPTDVQPTNVLLFRKAS
ncbi:tyrosine-type recombinase/integrase [Burkholderia pseudomallei]|nr:tyrosine-type recombinase/integrase [Burkholderia pseudomallei]MBF3843989.1 tyrosine-type recombinase/integrase [Burkholderia pseudomallei]